MKIGFEWLVDAAGCRADELTSVSAMQRLFDRIVAELDLHPVQQSQFHVFPATGGITGFLILSESHLACHTYPEHGIITLNLYCCRWRPEWPWRDRLTELLGASEVRVRELGRMAIDEVDM